MWFGCLKILDILDITRKAAESSLWNVGILENMHQIRKCKTKYTYNFIEAIYLKLYNKT